MSLSSTVDLQVWESSPSEACKISNFICENTDGFIDITDKVYRIVLSIPLIIAVCLTKLFIVNKQNWTKQ